MKTSSVYLKKSVLLLLLCIEGGLFLDVCAMRRLATAALIKSSPFSKAQALIHPSSAQSIIPQAYKDIISAALLAQPSSQKAGSLAEEIEEGEASPKISSTYEGEKKIRSEGLEDPAEQQFNIFFKPLYEQLAKDLNMEYEKLFTEIIENPENLTKYLEERAKKYAEILTLFNAMKTENTTLKEEMARLQETLKKKLKTEKSNIEKVSESVALIQKDSKIDQLTEEKETLKKQVEGFKTELEQLRSQVQVKPGEYEARSQVQEALKNAQQENTQLKAKVQETETYNTNLLQKIEEVNQKIRQETETREQALQRLKTAEELAAEKEQQSTNRHAALEKQLQDSQKANKTLQQATDVQAQEINAYEEFITRAGKQAGELQKQLKDYEKDENAVWIPIYENLFLISKELTKIITPEGGEK